VSGCQCGIQMACVKVSTIHYSFWKINVALHCSMGWIPFNSLKIIYFSSRMHYTECNIFHTENLLFKHRCLLSISAWDEVVGTCKNPFFFYPYQWKDAFHFYGSSVALFCRGGWVLTPIDEFYSTCILLTSSGNK
jgi:hypothetical protein